MQYHTQSLSEKQCGATLVVALVLLVLLSLIGSISLKNAVSTERMAGAVYQKNTTFQASESAAAIATASDSQVVADAIRGNTEIVRDIDTGSNRATARVAVEPLGSGAVLGSSLGDVAGYRLKVTSTGRLTEDDRVQTVTVHGIVVMGVAM